MNVLFYDRINAVNYAINWATKRNPKYYNFDLIGGDCTNFVSQCIYAGTNTMNYTHVTGWYYNAINDRTASWTSVEYLYKFLINNNSEGPFGVSVNKSDLSIGDVIELGRSTGEFYHSLIISDIINNKIYVCSHTFDALNKPLSNYLFERARYIKILGYRTK